MFFLFVFFVGSFPFFVFNRKPCFPPKKGHFFVFFQGFPFFLPSLFWPPPFSLSLSLSLSLFFFSFFLPSCLSFLLSFCFFVFVSFFIFLSSLLLFHEKNNIKILNYKVFVHQSFLIFVGFLSSFFFQIPFPYLFSFPDFKFCFCSTSVFSLNASSKTHFFQKRVCNITVFFLSTCVLQNVKSYRFWHFCHFS